MINGNACFAYFNKNWGIPTGCCHQHSALDHNHLRIGNGLGRESMFVAKLKAEYVARQMEATYLETTVAKYLRRPHDTDGLVGVISFLAGAWP